ncbi:MULTISPECIES: hypothetical protein [Stutzerimonas]|uniref:hypothetical protein n=1 Tax=Stutzerimonas TaxID=2901164 RepID=UPI00241F6B0F|nr:hypothetical protein [Stutzerimonas kunmingensis]
MSTVETWISIIGSLASIGGAAWAFIEARDASRSASRAERVRSELVTRREMVELSQIHTETKRILGVVSRIGPSSSLNLLTGIDCSSIAKDVEEYCRLINEHSTHYSELFKNHALKLCSDLNGDITSLADATQQHEKKEIGTRIYHKINSFLPVAKNLADEKKETIATGN